MRSNGDPPSAPRHRQNGRVTGEFDPAAATDGFSTGMCDRHPSRQGTPAGTSGSQTALACAPSRSIRSVAGT